MSARSRVLKLVQQIDRADGRLLCPAEHKRLANSLTDTEQDFFLRAVDRGMAVLRSGWPDFLVTERSGRTYGVEVKSQRDELRKSQKRMFAALERVGIKTYVWTREDGSKLVPWRRWGRPMGSRGVKPLACQSESDREESALHQPPHAREGES